MVAVAAPASCCIISATTDRRRRRVSIEDGMTNPAGNTWQFSLSRARPARPTASPQLTIVRRYAADTRPFGTWCGIVPTLATSRVLGTDPPAATVLPNVFSDRMALSWRISHGDLCGNLVQDEMREAYPRCAGSLPSPPYHGTLVTHPPYTATPRNVGTGPSRGNKPHSALCASIKEEW